MNDELKETLHDSWERWGCFGTLGLALALVGIGTWFVKRENSPQVGADVRSVAFLDAQGQRHTLAEYSGKVVLVDVWATWCPPCRARLPELATLQAKAEGQYAVLPISVDDGGFAQVTPFLARQAGPLKALQAYVPEGRNALEPFGPIRGIPTTIIVDPTGRIRTRWSGYGPGKTEAELGAAMGK